MKKGLLVFMLLVLMIFSSACSSNQPATNDNHEPAPGEVDQIVIVGSDIGEKMVTVAEIKELPAVETDVVSVNSSGAENKFSVKGALLADILETIGQDQAKLSAVRFVAGDGYMIEVPHEVLAARDIIFAYEIDGEPLEERTKPIRAIIPEERAMYWVRNLLTVEILNERATQSLDKLLVLENAVASMQQVDYTYYESVDKAVACSGLFSAEMFNGTADTVYMKASDGLEKNEKSEVFDKGYLKVTGKEVPAFVSPDIPKGMYVKDILWLSKANVGLLSAEEAYNYFTLTQQGEHEGITLTDLFAEVFMAESSMYLFTATDGYTVEISQADIAKGLLFVNEEGEIRVRFDGLPKNSNIKGLLSIEAKK